MTFKWIISHESLTSLVAKSFGDERIHDQRQTERNAACRSTLMGWNDIANYE